jgi:metallo-beta-lactamase family protein
MPQAPKSIVLVHGERCAKAALANALKRRFEGLQWATQIRVPV